MTADEAAITELLYSYGEALDSKDWPLLRSCFTDQAVVELDGFGRHEGIEAIETVLRSVEQLAATQHVITNPLIVVDGDRAQVSSYIHGQHVLPDTSLFTVGGRYDDTLVRTDEGWRLAERSLQWLWTKGDAPMPDPPKTPKVATSLTSSLLPKGGPNNDDPQVAATELMGRYVHAIDQQSWPLVASYFTADANVSYGPEWEWVGADAVAEGLRKIVSPLAGTQHFISNVVITAGVSNRIQTISQLIVHHGDDDGRYLRGGGTYYDVLERDPKSSEWLFAGRRFVGSWIDGDVDLIDGNPTLIDDL